MRVILNDDKQFIVKIQYKNDVKTMSTTDEWNRKVVTIWTEKTTIVAMYQWTKDEYATKLVVKGMSHCNFKDKYNKKLGKKLAYYNAVTKLVELGIVNEEEAAKLDEFDLNAPTYDCRKITCACRRNNDVKLDCSKSYSSEIDKTLADSIKDKLSKTTSHIIPECESEEVNVNE